MQYSKDALLKGIILLSSLNFSLLYKFGSSREEEQCVADQNRNGISCRHKHTEDLVLKVDEIADLLCHFVEQDISLWLFLVH